MRASGEADAPGHESQASLLWQQARAGDPADIGYGDIGDHAGILEWLTTGLGLALRNGDPLPRGHTELSARTWPSVTALPVTHLLGCQSGTSRFDTAAPVRPGHSPQVTAASCPDCRQARTS